MWQRGSSLPLCKRAFHGKRPQHKQVCIAVNRQPTDFGLLSENWARGRFPMDGMVIPASYVEEFERSWKTLDSKHPPRLHRC
jgi:hypothetical protein